MRYPECYRSEPDLSRRDFLIGTAAAMAAALVGEAGWQRLKDYGYDECLEVLDYRQLPYEGPRWFTRGGIGFNLVCAGLLKPEEYRESLDFVTSIGGTAIRAFFDSANPQGSKDFDFEPQLGKYQPEILDRFVAFCREAVEKDLDIIIVLMDGFRMGTCLINNSVFGSKGEEMLSPYYNAQAAEGPWPYFYRRLGEPYMNRAEKTLEAIKKGLKDILAKHPVNIYIEPMNEPWPVTPEDMNRWVGDACSEITHKFGFPTLAGVNNPETMTAEVTGTCHFLPLPLDWQTERYRAYLADPSILMTEFGMPNRVLGIPLDQDRDLRDLLVDHFFDTHKIDKRHRTVQPLREPKLFLWQGNQHHLLDGYLISDQLTQVMKLIKPMARAYALT